MNVGELAWSVLARHFGWLAAAFTLSAAAAGFASIALLSDNIDMVYGLIIPVAFVVVGITVGLTLLSRRKIIPGAMAWRLAMVAATLLLIADLFGCIRMVVHGTYDTDSMWFYDILATGFGIIACAIGWSVGHTHDWFRRIWQS